MIAFSLDRGFDGTRLRLTDADGNFIPMEQWDESNWPSHIHPPRKEANS